MIDPLFPVVILAGGLATRLRPLTEQIPKALVPINGQPFISHQLKLLKCNEIKHVVLCIGFLGEHIQAYVGDGSRFGLTVSYSFDGEQLLGTAGAIKQALPHLSDNFFVLNGDSYLPCHYLSVQNAFKNSKQCALMSVFRNNDQWDKSNIEFENQRILAYDKVYRTSRMQHIDYGLSVMHRDAFSDIPANTNFDLALLYQQLLQKQQLAAFEIKERFYEVGSFSGIQELEHHLAVI